MINVKIYQFKTHCKGDSHSSRTANIILPGLTIKQRCTPLRLQAKYSRLFNLGEMSCLNQHNGSSMNLNTISLADIRTFTFVLS